VTAYGSASVSPASACCSALGHRPHCMLPTINMVGPAQGGNVEPQRPWSQFAFILGEAGLSVASSAVLLIVISRVAGPEVLGAYALALAWLALFQGLSSFGIPAFLLREIGEHGHASRQASQAIWLGLVTGAAAVPFMIVTANVLGYSHEIVLMITVSSLALVPSSLAVACRSVFLSLRRMHLGFLVVLVEFTIVMILSLHLMVSGYGALALLIVIVVGKMISGSISLALLHFRIGMPLSFDCRRLIQTASVVLPFGVGSMLGMLTMRINTIMVSMWVGIATVGEFAAATKIMEMGLIVPNLFTQILMTRLAYSFNAEGRSDPNAFRAWYQALFGLVLPMCVGVWLFAEFLLATLFGESFADAAWILRILMIYLAIEAADSMMSATLQAAHRQRQDVTRLAFNPLTNVVLNLLLVPTLGTMGAALGRVGGVAVSAVLRTVLINHVLASVNWFKLAFKPGIISIGVGATCFVFRDIVHPAALLLCYVIAITTLLAMSSTLSLSVIKDLMASPRPVPRARH
jgi:stage V sporulation protein B